MKIEIDSRLLRAALICAGKADIRYYINAVAIEVHADRCFVLATDGHRLFIGRSNEAPKGLVGDAPITYIIPRELVERAIRSLQRKFSPPLTFTLPPMPEGEVEIRAFDAGFTGALTEGRFPDWRRVASVQRSTSESGQFKPEYVADCQRVAECFIESRRATAFVDIAHNGPQSAALVTFSTTANACIFLMPLRSFESRSVKDWLKLETGAEWDMPEVKP